MNAPGSSSPPDELSGAGDGSRQKRRALLAYVLHALAPFLVLATAIAGLVLNYLLRGEAPEPWHSHHQWMIRTFWIALVGMVVGTVTAQILIGVPIILVTAVWWLYRMIRGLLRLSEDRPPLG